MIIRSLLKATLLSPLMAAPVLVAWAADTYTPVSSYTLPTPPTSTTSSPVVGRVLRVGPTQALRTIASAAAIAKNGDTIEIDPGDYVGDVAVWTQDQLTIRGVGATRPRLLAGGKNAQGKGIWVVRGGKITVENLVFKDAKVADRNGAGIRFELGSLTLRNCAFLNNENGILTSAGGTELIIENSEFGYNGYGDGQSHGIYAGPIKKLQVTGSYFHHGKVGHLLKSRASENYIMYNRLSDETGGTSSYELEFPNGGAAYVIGNVIQQSAATSNSTMVSYGMEGYGAWTVNELNLSYNTLVDDRPSGGIFLAVKAGAQKLLARNNVLVGKGDLNKRPLLGITQLLLDNNITTDWSSFAQPAQYDYRVKDIARPKLASVSASSASNGLSLAPQREYVHPANTKALTTPVTEVGAIQSR